MDAEALAQLIAGHRQAVAVRLRQVETEQAEAKVREGERSKRRRVIVRAVGLLLVVLALGLAGTAWGLQLAWKRLAQVEQGVESLADVLQDVNPYREGHNGLPLYQQIRANAEAAAERLSGERVGDPEAQARLQAILGHTLTQLGSTTKGIALLETALKEQRKYPGEKHFRTLATMNFLAEAYQQVGRPRDGLRLLREAMAILEAEPQNYPELVEKTRNNLISCLIASGRHQEAYDLADHAYKSNTSPRGTDDPRTQHDLCRVAVAAIDLGRPEMAIELFQQVFQAENVTLQDERPHNLDRLEQFARALLATGQVLPAANLYEHVVTVRTRKLGENHPATLRSLSELGVAFLHAGNSTLAIQACEQARKGYEEAGDSDHILALSNLNNLARAHQKEGNFAEAARLFEQVYARQLPREGFAHPNTLTTLNNLAQLYLETNQTLKALDLLERANESLVAEFPAEHPLLLRTQENLFQARAKAGKPRETIAAIRELLQLAEQAQPVDVHRKTRLLQMLGVVCLRSGEYEQAIEVLPKAAKWHTEHLGPNHPDTIAVLQHLGVAYMRAKQPNKAADTFLTVCARLEETDFVHRSVGSILADATGVFDGAGRLTLGEQWRRKWVDLARARHGEDSPLHAFVLAHLGINLRFQKRWAEAEETLRRALAILEKHLPRDWRTYHTQAMLGTTLMKQDSLFEAEFHLVAGYEGMKRQAKAIPADQSFRAPEILARITELYTRMNNPEQLKKWQAEQARTPGVQPAPNPTTP